MSISKTESIQWLQQALADFCNTLPPSARMPVGSAARFHLANAISTEAAAPATAAPDLEQAPEKL